MSSPNKTHLGKVYVGKKTSGMDINSEIIFY